MEFVEKNKKLLIVVGAVAAVVVVGKIANDKNGWFDNLFKKKEEEKEKPADEPPAEKPASIMAASRQPRGKLPWSIGDVGLWDDENPSYCNDCSAVCDQSYAGKSSTQCEMCQSACAANVRARY